LARGILDGSREVKPELDKGLRNELEASVAAGFLGEVRGVDCSMSPFVLGRDVDGNEGS